MTQESVVLNRGPAASRRTAQALALVAITLVLTACASRVPLNESPVVVVDRSSAPAVSPLQQAPVVPPAQSGGADQRGVAPVQVAPTAAEQPEVMARVVYFDYDSFVVKPDFAATLEANARYLAANRSRSLALEGHTDERGGREYNLALGQKRAEAVRRALVLLGVNDAQVEPVSLGEEKPAVVGFSEEAYAKNRRVEFSYR